MKKQIRSNKSLTCISTNGQDLVLEQCDPNNENQKWDWNETYLSDRFYLLSTQINNNLFESTQLTIYIYSPYFFLFI